MAEEAKLLQASMDGDTTAFEQIVKKYQSLVCAITFSGTGRLDISEELAQETFLSAWKNLRQLKELGGFRPWLCTIARNLLNNYYRRKKTVSLESADFSEIADESSNPSETLITQEEHAMLEQTLMQMQAEYREPLVMYYRQGQSVRDVAVGLGLNESTVRTRLHRARQMLREEIATRLERTLQRTAPGKGFTKAVMVAVGGAAIGLSAGADAATASASTAGVTSSGGIATVMSTVTAKVITAVAAVVVIAAGVLVYTQATQSNETSEQRNEIALVQDEQKAIESSEGAELIQEEVIEDVIEELEGETANLSDIDESKGDMENGNLLAADIDSTASENAIQMGIHVFDEETEKPLSGVNLRVNRGCGCQCEPDNYATDDKGFYQINFGESKPSYLSILASKAGHVPMMFAWRDKMIEKLEDEFSFYLPRGKKIGGVIENEKGEPIASAKVVIFRNDDESREHPWIRIDDDTINTDPNGRWVCDIFPEKPHSFSVKLRHPDYVNTRTWINDRDYKYEEFYQQESVLIMKDGILLSGFVSDSKGNPIEGASVFTGEDRYDDESPRATTDSQGRFEFSHFLPRLNPGRVILTVQAKGYSPELEVIPMRDEMEPVLVTLEQPHTIRVRVVDAGGNPIVGVGVNAENWREYRSLSWQSTTDAEGRFVWNEAPADEVEIDIYREGYMRVAKQAFIARDEEYEVVMVAPLVISGSVVDAETNEAIKQFTACPGIKWENSERISWDNDAFNTKDFTDGRYEFILSHPYPGHLIRIDAEGYLPAKSRIFTDDEGAVTYNFQLEKGTGPGGVVYTPDGLSAEKAEIYVVSPNRHLSFDNGKLSSSREETEWAVTDENGVFSFKGLLDDSLYKLVVLHDEGFNEIGKEHWLQDPNIMLWEWGRIEGTLYSGLKVAPNQDVHYYSRDTQNNPEHMDYYYSADAITDNEGHFAIERVIPGRGSVARTIDRGDGGRSYFGTEEIEIVAGETTVVEIGGGGRLVTGTLVKPQWAIGVTDIERANLGISPVKTQKSGIYEEIYAEMELPKPERFDEMTVAEVMEWYRQWNQSDEGQAVLKEIQKRARDLGIDGGRHYNPMVEPDGSFQILGVLPGEYTLNAGLRKVDKNGYPDYREPVIAEIKYKFIVDDITEDNQDIPIGLGTIEFTKPPTLELNEPVPDFNVRSLDSNKLSLAAFRGKYLLLTFYHVAGTEEEIANLKRIQDDFSDDKRFEIMGVSHGGWLRLGDELIEKFIAEQGLTWHQGIIDTDNREILEAYHIQNWPQSLLIGPDGTLLANGLKGEELYAAVAEALAQ